MLVAQDNFSGRLYLAWFVAMVAIADKSVELMMNENPRDTL